MKDVHNNRRSVKTCILQIRYPGISLPPSIGQFISHSSFIVALGAWNHRMTLIILRKMWRIRHLHPPSTRFVTTDKVDGILIVMHEYWIGLVIWMIFYRKILFSIVISFYKRPYHLCCQMCRYACIIHNRIYFINTHTGQFIVHACIPHDLTGLLCT